MADVLLNKVLNERNEVQLLIKWLLKQEKYVCEFDDCGCSQTEFLTYFLNFIHEEIPCQNRCGDTFHKNGISKQIEGNENEEIAIEKKPALVAGSENSDINKSASYPLSLNRGLERNDTSQDAFSYGSSPAIHCITSTPKMLQVQLESRLTNGYTSPVSPLYKTQHSFNTPKMKRPSTSIQKSSDKSPSFCLGDFIVNKRPSAKKKASRNLLADQQIDESSKRITPTSLSQIKMNSGFRKTENSFNNFENTKEVPLENVNDSRMFLAEERLKILLRKNSGDNLVVPRKLGSFMIAKAELEADVDCVSNKNQLDCFVEIYICILRNSFILNITSEVYFLISLLLSKKFIENASVNSSDDFQTGVDFLNEEDRCGVESITNGAKKTICSGDLFETIHNMTYFAAKCLESQLDILKHYDKATLKLLSRNERLRTFAFSFADKLAKIAEKKSDRVPEPVDNDVQTNVCFNLDTDNRSNFPNDLSFHSFRKQRDLFYEILGIWENNHSLPGWSFVIGLGGKIRGLFGLPSEPANFMHFSRLFKAQLLGTCGKTQMEEGLMEDQLPFLSSLSNVDVDKLNRLKSRLVTKQSSNGINSLPAFTGYQEFYKDFIVVAGNYAFNKHLCDTLVDEIVELNNTKFTCTDLDESDVSVDPSTRKAYVAYLKSLRVLAKFLGFIESLPYKSECTAYSEHQLTAQLSTRAQLIPTFDVKQLLFSSLKQNSLILTVPWITEYISMLDYVTLRLPYYTSVCKMLFDLYKNYQTKTRGSKSQYNYNVSLLKFCLGWLFDQPHFPDSDYFNFCMSSVSGDVQTLGHRQKNQKAKDKETKDIAIDDLAIVDQNVLYICCPYLEEIKKLLSSNALNRSVTVRHITPVTAAQSSSEITKKRLEQQLEEAFFNGQSISVRKTVEFVSDRVASTCVKQICNSIVPEFKKSALDQLRTFLASWKAELTAMSPGKDRSQKAALKTKVNQMAQNNLKTLRYSCDKEIANITKEKIPTAIGSLLAVDVLTQTRDVCCAIATRMCIERVRQWINSHVVLSVFTKDFDSEVQKTLNSESKKVAKDKPNFMLPPGGCGKRHDEASTSAFHLLEKLKGLSVDILERRADITEDFVLNLLQECYVTLTERGDVNECITAYICTHLVDFALLLIAHKSTVMASQAILLRFTKTWRCYWRKTDDLFKNLLCLRNRMLLAQSCDETVAWNVFAMFIAFLIKQKMLDSDDFASQCTGFFKRDWDESSLKIFTTFLHKFVEYYKSNGGSTDKFTFLLEFLSDFCSDL